MNKPVKTIFALIFILILNIGSLGLARAASTDTLIDLTNASRAANGLANVTENNKLNTAALAKANDMFTNQYFAHTSPAGKTPWDFIKAAGFDYTYAGENLAIGYDSDQELHDAWMNSPTHRANIMSANFHEIGMAVVTGKYENATTTIVVQMFGTEAAPAVAEVPAPANTTTENPTPKVESASAQTPEAAPIAVPAKTFTLDQTKTNFAPSQIFAGEKVKFTVVLSGTVKTILVALADQKIDLMDAAAIQQEGDVKTYTKEVNIEKTGDYPVTLTVTSESGQSETMNMGTVKIAPKTLTNETVGATQNVNGFVHQYQTLMIIILSVLVLGLAGFLFYRFQKRPHLA